MGRSKVIGAIEKDGAKANAVDKLGIKVENRLRGLLFGPIHDEANRVINKGGMGVGDKSK